MFLIFDGANRQKRHIQRIIFQIMTDEEVLQKMVRYCNYRERNHLEVRLKLAASQVYGQRQENIVSTLIEAGYLNELRYARAFVSGKFRIHRWGRNKIKQELKQRQISEYSIKKALSEIDESEYWMTLEYLIEKRKILKKNESYHELSKYLLGRGFELSYIKEVLS